jgi:glyoxylase-like metal-dependent hydrolase (beta-lactamase superfamily II)
MDRKMFIKQSGTALLLTSVGGLTTNSNKVIEKPANMLKELICTTCGTQFPSGISLPQLCPICNDDRQYIGDSGQNWKEIDQLNKEYTVKINKVNKRLYELKMVPDFAIGQRAFLVIADGGNILWDCIPLLNEETITFIKSKGGLKAIAFSHPHYYSTMNEWARTFNCPVYIHQNDEEWVMYKNPFVHYWRGHEMPLWEGMKIINIGGHFPGSCIFHIPSMSANGTVLCGDSLYIAKSKRHIAIMHSYPNQIMLTKDEFISVYKKTEGLEFDTLHGAFVGQSLLGNADEIFTNSMRRYKVGYAVTL